MEIDILYSKEHDTNDDENIYIVSTDSYFLYEL